MRNFAMERNGEPRLREEMEQHLALLVPESISGTGNLRHSFKPSSEASARRMASPTQQGPKIILP
jgi:hypothetical protein